MRVAILFSLMLCACGDWSNQDLEYLYALPQKDQLKAELGAMSAGQGLRHDPLLGDHSDVYDGAVKASNDFNKFLDSILTGLDGLRAIHPTTRQATKRIWGPYADDKNPGFDVKAEIEKTGEKSYKWSLQARKRGTADFTTIAGGRFVATESLRKGQGDFFLDAVAASTLYGKMKEKPTDPDRVDFGYETSSDPVIVEIRAKVPSLTTPVGWDLNRYADGSGVFAFTVEGLMDPNATKISALVAYDAKGAGKVTYTILAGNYVGYAAEQCFDDAQKVIYEAGNWPGAMPAGKQSDCAEVKGLINLPPFP